MNVLRLVLLVLAANGLPLLLALVWPAAPLAAPLDGGRRWRDGRPLLGAHKTVRGALVMVLGPAGLAPWLGLSPVVGLGVGGLALLGDLVTSFAKRRLGVRAGGAVPGFDQLLEALLPLLGGRWFLGLGWLEVAAGTLAFAALDLGLSRLAWLMGIRRHPW